MKRHGDLLYASVPPNVIIVAGSISDYWYTLSKVERDQQAPAPVKSRLRKSKKRAT